MLTFPQVTGPFRGAERTRTADFLLAKQVLYQLSYRPMRGDHHRLLGYRV
jgi:hypothetical protein